MSDSNTIQHVQHVESVEKDINVRNKRVAIYALERIYNFCEEIDNHLPENKKTRFEMLRDYHIIKKYLMSDVRENVRGEWMHGKELGYSFEHGEEIPYYNKWFCSECGFEPYYSRDIHTLNYCPNCGADMREDKK